MPELLIVLLLLRKETRPELIPLTNPLVPAVALIVPELVIVLLFPTESMPLAVPFGTVTSILPELI